MTDILSGANHAICSPVYCSSIASRQPTNEDAHGRMAQLPTSVCTASSGAVGGEKSRQSVQDTIRSRHGASNAQLATANGSNLHRA
jgi:hypothetical protein